MLDESNKLNYDRTNGAIIPQELVNMIYGSVFREGMEAYDGNEDNNNEHE